MTTLVHEDIYVHIDKLEEQTTVRSGKIFSFTNDATNSVADLGNFRIRIVTNTFTSFSISDGRKTITVTTPMVPNDIFELDFRNLIFTKNGAIFYLNDVFDPVDNAITTFSFVFIGTATSVAEVTYKYNMATTSVSDLYFCESLDYSENVQRIEKVNIKNETKTLAGEKKTYTFSINGLWNETELNKFSNKFNLRLLDEQSNLIDVLANCTIDQLQKSSQANGDFVYSISGKFEKLF